MTIIFLIISIIVLFYVCYYTFYAIKRCILRNLAVDVIVTLNKYNVDYWVDFGTLLGIVREQDIIFGDKKIKYSTLKVQDNITKKLIYDRLKIFLKDDVIANNATHFIYSDRNVSEKNFLKISEIKRI